MNLILSNVGPLWPWISLSTYDFTQVAPWITLLAILLPLSIHHIYKQRQKTQAKNAKPFPFTSLPRELRDMVYSSLITSPTYHIPPPSAPPAPSYWKNPHRWISHSLRPHPPTTGKSTWIILANKQLHNEFIDIMCRKQTLHLTLSPSNYSSPPHALQDPSSIATSSPKIWNITPSTLAQIRTATLRLVTTSHMLGVMDPRDMKSEEWGLARQVQSELSGMRKVREFALQVTAVGDPLWNPLWIWWHVRRGVGDMGDMGGAGHEVDEDHQGPKFTKITFSLDTWSPGENHLRRDGNGRWVWCCGMGHVVGRDGGRDMTIREFCAKLYQECEVCREE